MKKLLVMAFIMLTAFQVQAQKKVSEYSMSYLEGMTYDVMATIVKNGNFDYYVNCASFERKDDIVGIVISSKSLNNFVDCLRNLEGKFTEWSETAKKNNVTDYSKEFDVNFPSTSCYFKYGDFHFAFNRKMKARFVVTSEGRCLAILAIRDLQASDNRFMDHDGLLIAFSSVDEIESFIKAIDPQNALDNDKNETEKEKLFN